jgi:2-methylisocitrate lyase-like PEP mutase family enzyme
MSAQAATAFRALHTAGRPLLLPNAWDYASAAALAAAGFGAIGTTSLGVAAAHGLPDAQGRARAETLALARRLGGLPCPFTVDIEAGFSDDPAEVADLAAALHDAGAAGINLEDGRRDVALASPRQQCELIAAVKARVPGLFLNARIDTYWLGIDDPPRRAATLDRAGRYLAAGADGIFVPGAAEAADIEALVTRVAAPVNMLYLPGRHTVRELTGLGVQRISTGSLLFRTAVHAAVEAARAVRDGRPAAADVPTYAEIQQLIAGRGRPH